MGCRSRGAYAARPSVLTSHSRRIFVDYDALCSSGMLVRMRSGVEFQLCDRERPGLLLVGESNARHSVLWPQLLPFLRCIDEHGRAEGGSRVDTATAPQKVWPLQRLRTYLHGFLPQENPTQPRSFEHEYSSGWGNSGTRVLEEYIYTPPAKLQSVPSTVSRSPSCGSGMAMAEQAVDQGQGLSQRWQKLS